MASHKHIEDEAASWLAERDSDEWTNQRQAELTRWLEASTANRVAFLRVERAWEETRRLRALGAGIPPGTVPPRGAWRRTPFFTSHERVEPRCRPVKRGGTHEVGLGRVWLRWGAAAVVLLALGFGIYFKFVTRDGQYSTPVGEVASVPLKDGSKITLNTASAVRVDLTPAERRVDLERGEAFFVVAKDPGRPFVVKAGNKRIVAVGTQFSVRRDGGEVRVVVTEGAVRLESVGRHRFPQSPSEARPGSVTPDFAAVTAAMIARATDEDVLVQKSSISEVEAALSWREGYLTFHETPLAEAVAEFNRYNTRKITIEDPHVAGIRISGTFRPTNYEAFVRLLQEAYGIHAQGTDRGMALTNP